MTIVDQIKNNHIEVLSLREMHEDYFRDAKEFLAALSKNTSIDTIKLSHDFLGCLLGSDRVAVVNAIGKLPNVQTIKLAQAGIQVPALIAMVKNAKKLKSLDFDGIVFQGLEPEFGEFERALRSHSNLKSVSIHKCHPSIEGIDLNKLVQAGNKQLEEGIIRNGKVTLPHRIKRSDSAIAA